MSAGTIFVQRYVVERVLGGRREAVAYLARDDWTGRRVVLKVLSARPRPEFVARFEREARVLGALRSPHVVRLFDHGVSDGAAYLVLQYRSGRTLRECLDAGETFDPRRVSALLEQLLDALADAHQGGILHRDIQPANIVLDSNPEGGDFVVLGEFGIAKPSDSERLTQTGYVLGDARYMSPEQLLGGTVDPRSDLYALGLVAYELLAGGPALPEGLDDVAVAARLRDGFEPQLPGEVRSTAVGELVTRLTRHRASERPANAEQASAFLRPATREGGDAPLASSGGARGNQRRLWLVAGALAVVTLGLGGLVVGTGTTDRQPLAVTGAASRPPEVMSTAPMASTSDEEIRAMSIASKRLLGGYLAAASRANKCVVRGPREGLAERVALGETVGAPGSHAILVERSAEDQAWLREYVRTFEPGEISVITVATKVTRNQYEFDVRRFRGLCLADGFSVPVVGDFDEGDLRPIICGGRGDYLAVTVKEIPPRVIDTRWYPNAESLAAGKTLDQIMEQRVKLPGHLEGEAREWVAPVAVPRMEPPDYCVQNHPALHVLWGDGVSSHLHDFFEVERCDGPRREWTLGEGGDDASRSLSCAEWACKEALVVCRVPSRFADDEWSRHTNAGPAPTPTPHLVARAVRQFYDEFGDPIRQEAR